MKQPGSLARALGVPPRTQPEREAVARARLRLDQLDLYPRPVDVRHVRIFHTPWLFRIPGFRRYWGYELGPLILIRRPLDQVSDDLIVHELCHVWQSQHRMVRMWLSYLYEGYRNNRHEVEARHAAAATARGSAWRPSRRTALSRSPDACRPRR